ncbi:MAG: cytochrome c oxidase subunit 3 family protein [Planctomycetota bacterium]|nr:cytochrome c oxidase subunit 3 family protein [Planctomycetota bacterium]
MATTEAALILAPQFDDAEQQHDSDSLGMWVFLVTEVMFFGGLFAAYAVYRYLDFPAFVAASRRLSVTLGAINTAVLLTSSLTMALAVRAVQLGRRRELVYLLLATISLGAVFLGIKAYEYYDDYLHHLIPGSRFAFDGPFPARVEMFFVLYFFMTGLHAFHLIVGIIMVGIITFLAWRRRSVVQGTTQVELVGLYWHFIDLVWIFLYPMLYLVDIHR